MDITLKQDLNIIDWAELATVYERAPLGRRDPDKLQRAYHNSYAYCFAYDGERLVGAARVISDGEYYAGVFDVVVLPEYQSCGIGSQMMTRLLADTPVSTVLLSSVPGKEGFYAKLGFAKLKTSMGKFGNPDKIREMGYIE